MPKQTPKKPDYEQLGRMLENIYETGYADRKKIYSMSFVKGIATGFGGVIGATVMIALFIWVLSLFNDIPLIGNFVDSVQSTLESK
jgi:hypothetical protein